MKHWAMRFGVRLALYGGGLYGLLKLTATHFDATEWNALILFLAMLVFVEGAMAVLAGNWPQRKKGHAPWEVAAAVGVLAFVFYEPPRRSGYVEARDGECPESVLARVEQDLKLARSR